MLPAMVMSLAEARAAGLSRQQLRGKRWTRVGPGMYATTAEAPNPLTLLRAVARNLPPAAVFSGRTAAWLHGLDAEPTRPIEVTLPTESGISSAAGVRVRRARLPRAEVVELEGLAATSIARTLRDLAWRLPLTEAVVFCDMALRARLLDRAALDAWVDQHRGRKGVRRMRAVLDLADGRAESAMESRLRVLLVRAGLPRPRTQVPIFDAEGHFAGRVDLYFPDANLAIEYDGSTHRDSLVADNRRQNDLLRAGVNLLRYCADDVYRRPHVIVAQTRHAFASAGIGLLCRVSIQPKPSRSRPLTPV